MSINLDKLTMVHDEKNHRFIMVHSYRTKEERQNLIQWEATIRLVRSVDEWKQLYSEEDYEGLYYWKIFNYLS